MISRLFRRLDEFECEEGGETWEEEGGESWEEGGESWAEEGGSLEEEGSERIGGVPGEDEKNRSCTRMPTMRMRKSWKQGIADDEWRVEAGMAPWGVRRPEVPPPLHGC